jgi:hypothetical protein
MKLPDDMFKQELLTYLTVDDIVNLDSACMNHKYRSQIMEKISGVILLGDKNECMKASLFKWLGMRQINLINMHLDFEDDNDSFSSEIENDYVDQFRYTQHLILRGAIIDGMAILIISHCPCLLSMAFGDYCRPYSEISDHTMQSIEVHCKGLQSLSLNNCRGVTDTGLITISNQCTGLQSLDLCDCNLIIDASIISISNHCTGLQSVNLCGCDNITDASIISISIHCTRLQSLSLFFCNQITDASIIIISENCTGLKELFVSYIAITDSSLIAIAKNCTGLKYLTAYDCYGLSSKDLRHEFKSVSDLRAVLLSIYPSLLI